MTKALSTYFKKTAVVFYFFALVFIFVFIAAAFWDLYLENKNKRPVPEKSIGFNTQFLHPYYFFSFPTRADLLQKINSADSWIDERGFRGPGPEAKGLRQLAFLLGGSTAFGDGASTNNTTISGVLNRIQEKYFFVNAGVPSWNSFQELLRFLKQVQNENPALVVSLSGYNDIITAYRRKGSRLPADAPESFENLESWVEDIRSNQYRQNAVEKYLYETSVFRNFRFENLSRHFGYGVTSRDFDPVAKDPSVFSQKPISSESLIDQTANRYKENMSLMKLITDAKKSQFLVFFQPFKFASKNYELGGSDLEFREFYLQIRSQLFKAKEPFFVDLSEPLKNTQLLPDEVFIDGCHFNDKGYEHIAGLIWSEIQKRNRL